VWTLVSRCWSTAHRLTVVVHPECFHRHEWPELLLLQLQLLQRYQYGGFGGVLE
jgi:hypothetical protein